MTGVGGRWQVGVGACLAVAFAGGCIGGPRTPLRDVGRSDDIYVQPQTPIGVRGDEMETVSFGQTMVDVPPGTTVSRLEVDQAVVKTTPAPDVSPTRGPAAWGRIGNDELRRAGYPVPGQEAMLFAQEEVAKSRYLVGGTMTRLMMVHHDSRDHPRDAATPVECAVTVRWQVYDTNARRVVLTQPEAGYAEAVGAEAVINGGVRSAFRSLLADPRMVAAVRRVTTAGGDGGAAPARPPLSLAVPAAGDLRLPDQMAAVTDAVVTVRVGSAHGSAFFVTPGGYLLTAAHVVAGRDTCLVRLGDGRQAEARVWRVDAAADVALLRVADGTYPALRLAPPGSPPPAVGTDVYAVGTPLTEDLDRSVSRGIVSAVRHSADRDAIQTDAAVNGGNSGGPLVDRTGHVVGIVSQKVALPGFSGIAFAIPIASAVDRLRLDAVPAAGPRPDVPPGR